MGASGGAEIAAGLLTTFGTLVGTLKTAENNRLAIAGLLKRCNRMLDIFYQLVSNCWGSMALRLSRRVYLLS